jgi:hypothetical protein
MNSVQWFRQIWPFPPGRGAAMAGYKALGAQFKHTLTDIALRNYVFHAAPPAADLYAAGVAEGRRQCALEIYKLAGINHDQLWALVEKKPEGNRT